MSSDVEQRLAAAIAASLDSVVTIDHEGRVLEFNPAAERTFGYTRKDVLGRRMVELIVPPELRDAHQLGIERYLSTGEARILGRRIELTGYRSNGQRFPAEVAVMRIDMPGPPMFTAFLRDLSESKRLEGINQLLLGASEILATSLDYEETLRNLSHVVVPAFADWYAVDIVGPTGQLRRLEVSHRDPERILLARVLADRFPERPDDPGGVYEAVRTGKSNLLTDISDEYLVKNARNKEHLALLRRLGLRSAIIAPLKADERVVGAITLVTAESERHYDERDRAAAEDLARRAGQAIEKAKLFAEVRDAREQLEQQATELEAQAEELAETASKAEEANRAKSDFLAAMSHELRTPLNAIMGYSQLLELGVHGTLQPKQLEDLKRIDRSAHHLLGLITDILNFAKIEAGRLEYAIERIALAPVLSSVEELIAPQAAAKKIDYQVSDACGDVLVCADSEKLVQIFVNIASNAVRFTSEGGSIVIECRSTKDMVYADVRDTGIGVPASKRQAIFEPFTQVDRGYAGHRQGTGLGLAISRDLARGMGGDLTVTSEMGKGSTFTVALRRAPGGAKKEP
jgi:PAS domain S-box-containing protein